jgi:uridine phosphorylase
MGDPGQSNRTGGGEHGTFYAAADLPIDDQGSVYHIQAKPGQLAPDILLVGDPGRAGLIGSKFLRDVEFECEHRGLVTITGTSQLTGDQTTIITPVRTTVATSGMGTSSLEIVLGELVALNEIDFHTRSRKPDFAPLHVVRVGTSGALQAATPVGTPIITSYAIGMDNTGLYYDVPYADDVCERLEGELCQLINHSMSPNSRYYGKIHPYVAKAEPAIVDALMQASVDLGVPAKLGLTASNSGFFAPQGRDIARVKPSVPDLDRILGEYDPELSDQRIENMEMEASFLCHFLGGLGYRAGAICTTVAHRREDTFDHDYRRSVENSIKVALLALATLRSHV